MTHKEAGALGIAACHKKYGPEFSRINGRLGGRPPLPTLEQMRQIRAGENERKLKEAASLAGTDNLKNLLRAYKLRQQVELPV